MKYRLLLLSILFFSCPAFSARCTHSGYVIGFFNGVWNSKADAIYSTIALQNKFGSVYNGESVRYEVFYNVTGSSIGSNPFLDIAELFRQRAEEIGVDGHYDIDDLNKLSDPGDLSKFDNFPYGVKQAKILLGSFSELFVSTAVSLVSKLVSLPPTNTTYEIHNTRLKTLVSHGYKVLFVAHSQGNLYANSAYNVLLDSNNIDSNNFGIVHVAPASVVTHGPHTRADLDLVISGLEKTGLVPKANVTIPPSHLSIDPTGHYFTTTYLNSDLLTSHKVLKDIDREISRLDDYASQAYPGKFSVTLTWDSASDIDLHIIEPTGEHVHFANKKGTSGELDIDNRTGFGPEHYSAGCENRGLVNGRYQIGLNNYSHAEGSKATIQVSTHSQANLKTKTVVMGAEMGQSGTSDPKIVMNVEVSQDVDGQYTIDAY
ncbi:YfaP family protein [Vibrio sp. WXL103]|uniref:YfaP family protein n=1 Tax=Vibrio sp. WXL103 TaxID=3450710 RepID=UPI003EC67DFA